MGKVFISDFDEQEIQRAAEKLDADTLDRIRSVLSTPDVAGSDYITLGDPIPRGTSRTRALSYRAIAPAPGDVGSVREA